MFSASGSIPKIMASVVITMGRNRVAPASTSASNRFIPALRCWLALSTRRIAFFTTRPISMMKPMIENMFRVDPPTSKPSITPTSASGSDDMIAKGCTKLPNCEASTR